VVEAKNAADQYMMDFVDAFLIAERDGKRRLATCLETIVWG